MERQDLCAGPLRLVLEEGAVRWVRLGNVEILRAIRAAVRDQNWGTPPHRFTAFDVDQSADSFRARFKAENREGPIALDWDGEIQGSPDGTLVYRFRGVARSTFLKSRIGLVVLHPVDECAGRSCTIETSDGRVYDSAFPLLVASTDPFTDLRAITHEVVPFGLRAEVRFDGEVFEMEDHRNWSDFSFKTFGTPLSRPSPVEVEAGTVIEQSVTLRLIGDRAAWPGTRSSSSSGIVVHLSAAPDRRLPRVGTRLPLDRRLSAPERSTLAALRLSHLRIDIDASAPDLADRFRWASEESHAVGCPLEVAVFLPAAPEHAMPRLADAASLSAAPIASWLVFDKERRVTTPGLARLAARWLERVTPGAPIGAGSDRYFAELNSNRPPPGDGDFLCHPSSPQVHDFDDATLIENLRSVYWMAQTARAFANGRPLTLSPVTLRPHGTSSDAPDSRQSTPFGAAWTAGHLSASVRSGIESLTYHDAVGPRGLMGPDGTAWPVAHALAAFSPFAGGRAAGATSSDALRVEAAFLLHPVRRVVLVNLTGKPIEATLSGLAEIEGCRETLDPYDVRTLDIVPSPPAL
jgi:hypothetical protein